MSGIAVSSPQLEKLSEIYSLIVSIDHVERAYIRDTIEASDYNEVMARLLSLYSKLVTEPEIETSFGDLDSFVRKFNVPASAGVQRIKVGILATAEPIEMPKSLSSSGKSDLPSKISGLQGRSTKAVADAVGHFITVLDGISLQYRTKSTLHPLLAELATSLNKVTKENFEGRGKIVEWLIRLNQLKEKAELTDAELAQCEADVQLGYKSFLGLLD